MIVLPRVHLRAGVCVRSAGWADGHSSSALGNAVTITRSWANNGFHRIQVVDLDAVEGAGSNAALLQEIIRDGAIDVQVCDGAHSGEQIEDLLAGGAVQVVLGDRALEDATWLAGVADTFPGQLVVATDVRERRVVTRGWVRTLPVDLLDLVDELNQLPLAGLLVSATTEGGVRDAVDLSMLEDVAEACECPVMVAGRVESINDLRALEHRGISAVLLGDELYEGQLDPRHVAMEFGDA